MVDPSEITTSSLAAATWCVGTPSGTDVGASCGVPNVLFDAAYLLVVTFHIVAGFLTRPARYVFALLFYAACFRGGSVQIRVNFKRVGRCGSPLTLIKASRFGRI